MSTLESQPTPAPSEGSTSAITLTKLQRPRVGHRLVARPQLMEQLNAAQSLTLVVASAGGGKTTLLSTWLETCNLPYAWLSLDERDNDLGLFTTYLIRALRALFPVVDNTLAAVSGVTLPSPDTIARTLINDLAAVEQDFILVLDDYQVIRNQTIHDLMTDILLHPPRTLHLVIASRRDPPLPLARLRARGDVTELRRVDLWFTAEETRRFLVECMKLSLDERAISVLTTNISGWPVGLRLLALYLRQQPTTMLAADTLGKNPYVMDYMTAEVLSHLPISIQEYLIKTSILDQLCGPLCEAVTGMSEKMASGQPILEWLERTDFFLTPMDDQQHWYRIHDIVRQFLRARLEQMHGSAEIAALHLRASAWYAANGDLDEALRQAVAAGDMVAVLQIVAQHRYDLLNRSEWQRADRWLGMFPREVIDEQPDLLQIEIWLKFIRNQPAEVPALLERVEALLPALPPERAKRLQGEVDARRAGLFYFGGDFARSIKTAQQALEKLPLSDSYLRGFARGYQSISYLAIGDLTRAYATFYQHGESVQEDSQIALAVMACFMHWLAGDLTGMVQVARHAVDNSALSDGTETATWSRYHLGLYHYQRNDLTTAEKFLLPLVMQPHMPSLNCFLNSAIMLARIRQVQGRPEEALEIVDLMISFGLELQNEVMLFNVRAFQAELALRQGYLAAASQWAEQYGPFRPLLTANLFVPPEVLALILLAQDTSVSRQQARELLARMNDFYSSIHYTTIRIRVLALQAMLFSAEGDEPQALATLSDSIALAAPSGFLRLFVDLGPALKEPLQKLARQGVAPAYINEILAAYGPDEASPIVAQPLTTTPGSALLTNRELDVLQLLARRYTDKEIAEALFISPKTVSTHIGHMGDKLGVRGRRAIVEAAQVHGILAD